MTKRAAKGRIENLVSAGGVVHRRVNGRVEAALCGRAISPKEDKGGATADSPSAQSYSWSLAKGTPEPGETLEQTALREVREETGLEVEIDAPLGTIQYWFSRRDLAIRYHKTVHYYLMAPIGGGTDLHDPEFDVVQWFPSEEALEALTYANEAEVLRRALEVLSKR